METIWGFVDRCCTWGTLFSLFPWDCRRQSVNLTGCHLGLLMWAKYLWVQVVGSQFWFSSRDQGGGPWINQWSTSTQSMHVENPVLYHMVLIKLRSPFLLVIKTQDQQERNKIAQFQKISILPQQKELEFPGAWGVVKNTTCMKFNWNFQSIGVLENKPSVGELWMFSGTF